MNHYVLINVNDQNKIMTSIALQWCMITKKTGIARLWTKVSTESTFSEVAIAATTEGRSTTTPYLPTHGLTTGDFQCKMIFRSKLLWNTFQWKLDKFQSEMIPTVNFCGPPSWILPAELSPRRTEPG